MGPVLNSMRCCCCALIMTAPVHRQGRGWGCKPLQLVLQLARLSRWYSLSCRSLQPRAHGFCGNPVPSSRCCPQWTLLTRTACALFAVIFSPGPQFLPSDSPTMSIFYSQSPMFHDLHRSLSLKCFVSKFLLKVPRSSLPIFTGLCS